MRDFEVDMRRKLSKLRIVIFRVFDTFFPLNALNVPTKTF